MTSPVWRIATDAPTYSADDLTGTGAKSDGGRWNGKGPAMIYAASSRALACLGTIVHLNAGGLSLNRYLVEITVPVKSGTPGKSAIRRRCRSPATRVLPVGQALRSAAPG